MMVAEVPFYGNRNLVHMLLSGVFERFPRLKFVITESGLAQFPPMLKHLDGIIASVRRGSIGELKYAEGSALPRSASEYFAQNVWVGASFPAPGRHRGRATCCRPDRVMWGSDYPHDEGTAPFTREHLRQVMRRPTRGGASGRSSARTRRSSTASISTRSRRWSRSTARPSRSCAAAHRVAAQPQPSATPGREGRDRRGLTGRAIGWAEQTRSSVRRRCSSCKVDATVDVAADRGVAERPVLRLGMTTGRTIPDRGDLEQP